MELFQKDFLKIIKSAVTGEPCSLSQEFNPEKTAQLAEKQSIPALVYYGALNAGVSEGHPAMQRLFRQTCVNILVNERQMYELGQVLSDFDREKIAYMPLKGTILKSLYPKPEMRAMGDVDILIRNEQYKTVEKIMLKNGFKRSGESNHDFKWKKLPGLHIELHKSLIPTDDEDYYRYYGDGWQMAKICDGTRYSMTDEDQMVYLFAHFAKHYRNAGIGTKHIVDLWVFRQKHPQLNEKYIEKELDRLHLLTFYRNVMRTLSVWFEDAPCDDVTDFITDVILHGGSFGQRSYMVLSETIKKMQSMDSVKKVKRSRMRNLLFPSYQEMCVRSRFLKPLPFLLPLVWMVRLAYLVLFCHERIRKCRNDSKLITADKITDYQAGVQFVGLDFNFDQ